MRRQVITLLVLVLFVLPLTAGLYLSSKSYPEKDSDADSLVSNAYVLKEAFPEQVYGYTMGRITAYHTKEAPKIDSYTIKNNKVLRFAGGYAITLTPSDGGSDVTVSFDVRNYGNFFSVSVKINGQLQGI